MKDKSLTRVSVFLTSQIISLFGSAIVSYSIVWYITLKTSSTMALAISIVCTYMPQIVISMFSGTWGDKFNKKKSNYNRRYDYWYFYIDTSNFIYKWFWFIIPTIRCLCVEIGWFRNTNTIRTRLFTADLPWRKINKNKWNLCYCFISNQYFISCYGRCFIKCNGFWTYPLYWLYHSTIGDYCTIKAKI